MKITKRQLRSLIKESFFKDLFKTKYKEKTGVPEEIASDFGGGSGIELSDDFELNPESDSGLSRRDFLKSTASGLIAISALGAGASFLRGRSVDEFFDRSRFTDRELLLLDWIQACSDRAWDPDAVYEEIKLWCKNMHPSREELLQNEVPDELYNGFYEMGSEIASYVDWWHGDGSYPQFIEEKGNEDLGQLFEELVDEFWFEQHKRYHENLLLGIEKP